MRQMTLVAFLQAQNCTNFVGSWRHPEASPDFMTADYYRHIARVLEAGKFHVGFFDDRLAMPDRFGGDHAHTVANGIRCVKMDPITILTVMGMATERLGLGSTCSTTYYEPFHVARVFQTLDLMTNGRAAWNIVTSMNDGEALNMGHAAHGEHDLRYDRADEFLEVVAGHWDSWDDDAIVLDKQTGSFAHPDKVRRLDHEGEFFRSRGPFTVPRSAQGHPVLIQAGQSGRGRRFAARWAELVFVDYHSLDRRKARLRRRSSSRSPMRDAIRRRWSSRRACIQSSPTTRAEAEDKVALIDRLPKEIDSLSLLSRSAERRSVEEAARRTVDRGRDQELDRCAGIARPRLPRPGQTQSDDARLHGDQPSRHVPRSSAVRRQPEGCRRRAWRNGLPRAPATATWSPPRTCPAATRSSSVSSSPNCNAAGCFTTTTAAPHCARTSVSSARASARGARFANNEERES